MALEQRDLYENLMLLCPNDHSTVDANATEWSVAKLREVKAEHELWVQKRLEQGTIRLFEAGVSDFAEERLSAWQTMKQHAWLFLSLTPVEVREEVLDPLSGQVQSILNSLPLPRKYHDVLGTILNSGNTEPSARGLLNEDFRHLLDGVGFRIEVFRNGHVEYVSCIDKFFLSEDYLLQRLSISLADLGAHRLVVCSKAIEYKWLAEHLLDQMQQLHKIWTTVPLPVADMLVTAGVLNCEGACLLAYSYNERRAFIGRCIEDMVLQYGTVVEKKWPLQESYNIIMSRLVNMMGLHLSAPWTGGEVPMPRYL